MSASSRPGGAERALLGLARSLPAAGVTPVAVVLEDGPLADWLDDAGVPPLRLPAHRFRRLDRSLATVLALRRAVREHGADVVLSNQSKTHVAGGAAALLAGVPAVWWQHGVPQPSRIERAAAAVPAAAIACVSEDGVAAQRRLTPRRRLERIPGGVPLGEVRAAAGRGAAIRERLGWSDRVVAGVVARLEPWKGQELFLRAAAELAREDDRLRFAVVGGAVLGWEGDYPQRLEALAAELGLGDRVHFAGHQEDAWAWLDALDVVVAPSLGEPFGLTVVEAMALGKPVVATDSGGHRETVEDAVSGLLVAPEPDALAAAIRRVVAEPELAASLAAGARERAELFDESRTGPAFAALFAAALES
ncbi:MAG TPA: glycosyltransferase family 4 protein [Gaiellaceae bacterium]|nr:glycosyltransferase family 4 protein [Gaiellaceae bacterium]